LSKLRNQKLDGAIFRRQNPIDIFIFKMIFIIQERHAPPTQGELSEAVSRPKGVAVWGGALKVILIKKDKSKKIKV
jgi:hypothetical protein